MDVIFDSLVAERRIDDLLFLLNFFFLFQLTQFGHFNVVFDLLSVAVVPLVL